MPFMLARSSKVSFFYRFSLVAALGLLAYDARAVVVERIVAVVGERPILLSDLRRRAKPLLIQLYTQRPQGGPEVLAEESKMMKQMLERMVEERLIEQVAEKQKKAISSEEVDKILKTRAESLKLSVRQLIDEARKEGFSEQEYRDEMRRQALEGKLLQLRLAGRVKVSEEDGRNAYNQWVRELGNEKLMEIRVLAMRMPEGASTQEIEKRVKEANDVVARARKGEDFCELIREVSDDAAAKQLCGSRGLQPTSAILPQLKQAVDGLKKGDVTEPIRFGNEAVVVLQLAQPPGVPAYEDVRPIMEERAINAIVQKQRKTWIDELRKGVYIDTRY